VVISVDKLNQFNRHFTEELHNRAARSYACMTRVIAELTVSFGRGEDLEYRSDIFGVFGPLRSLQNFSLSEWQLQTPWSQSKPVLRPLWKSVK